jgi:hypothetical protein
MTKLKRCFFAGFLPILIILGLLGYSGGVSATPILDFGIIAPTTGSISGGAGGPLVGTGIQVDNVVGIGTPNSNGVTLTIDSGILNFTTGNYTGAGPNTWNFGGGGSITITGGIDLDPLTPGLEIPLGSQLLSGTFTGASVISFGKFFKITGASFYDTKDPALTAFFGLPNGTYDGNFNISFNASTSGNSFSSTMVLSGDLTNSPVPEPATMLLFGCGLVGIGIFARRKFHRA